MPYDTSNYFLLNSWYHFVKLNNLTNKNEQMETDLSKKKKKKNEQMEKEPLCVFWMKRLLNNVSDVHVFSASDSSGFTSFLTVSQAAQLMANVKNILFH